MRVSLILFAHLLGIVIRLARPGGLRSVVAESVLVRHQLLIWNRGRKRAPNLRAGDRIITGLCTLFMLYVDETVTMSCKQQLAIRCPPPAKSRLRHVTTVDL
jgi:hypothetical protein